jgi:hypothetical protein
MWPPQLYLLVRELQAYANPGTLTRLGSQLGEGANLKGRRDIHTRY